MRLALCLAATTLYSLAHAVNSGTASFYGGNLSGGACLLSSLPPGVHGTALGGASWADSGMCGVCLRVTGPRGSVKVMVSRSARREQKDRAACPTLTGAEVVDKCPECGLNGLDLFQDAFPKIADPSVGKLTVSWTAEACGIGTPLVLRNKTGTSKWW